MKDTLNLNARMRETLHRLVESPPMRESAWNGTLQALKRRGLATVRLDGTAHLSSWYPTETGTAVDQANQEGSSPKAAGLKARAPSPSGLVPPTGWPRPATPCDLRPLWAGEFRDFSDWVNFASIRLTDCQHRLGGAVPAICVDALGRRCWIGADFHRARDEGAFPVRYFWECEPPHAPV